MNVVLFLMILGVAIFIGGIIAYHKVVDPSENGIHIVAFFAWFVGLIALGGWTHEEIVDSMRYREEVHEWYIHSLGNDKYLNGDFMLGTGTISETDYYFFYVKTVRGMSRIKVRVYDTYLIETDSRRPEYVEVVQKYDDEGRFWKVICDDKLFNKLYVPTGTIVREFSVR